MLIIMLNIISDAVISSDPCLPIYRCIPYVHFMRRMIVASMQSFFSTAGEREARL